MAEAKPIRLLIAALGGEGGGVLASWLHTAAISAGHFVQGTYIPGVAQRTGATTYYLELVPGAGARHGDSGERPVLALNAAPGEVDVMVASELLESTRAVQAGYVSPDRTILIASKARIFTSTRRWRWATAGSTSSACWRSPTASPAAPSSPISPPSLPRRRARSTPCCSAPLPRRAACRSRPKPSAAPSALKASPWRPTCAASRRGWRSEAVGSDPMARFGNRGEVACRRV